MKLDPRNKTGRHYNVGKDSPFYGKSPNNKGKNNPNWIDGRSIGKNLKRYRREHNFLYNNVMFCVNGGFCFICGETFPFYMVSHHLTPKTEFHLCANCHRKYHDNDVYKHRKTILKYIENGIMFIENEKGE